VLIFKVRGGSLGTSRLHDFVPNDFVKIMQDKIMKTGLEDFSDGPITLSGHDGRIHRQLARM
jgi:hypothetical protein